jgi:cytochrome c-type biogenesis protein CcmE
VDPQRKRKIRLVTALSVAVLLAVALVYTSFGASTATKEPSQLLNAAPGTYDLTGRVVKGSVQRREETMRFRVADRDGGESIAVAYSGVVPDPFRGGREIILTVEKSGSGTFVGERDTLVTKCPSKFTADDS